MILIIDCGSSKTPAIAEMASLFYSEVIVLPMDGIEQKTIENSRGIIISGAPILLSKLDAASYLHKFSFIKQFKYPVLGICFGHQIIGLLHGSEVFLGTPVRKPEEITIIEADPLFSGLIEKPLFVQDHTEGISLPNNFLHLAQSENYAVEAMKHPTKLIYGVQFHPEVSGENGKSLIGNFLKLVK
jgi:GMP synthase (glutamine-hydrolysing)